MQVGLCSGSEPGHIRGIRVQLAKKFRFPPAIDVLFSDPWLGCRDRVREAAINPMKFGLVMIVAALLGGVLALNEIVRIAQALSL